MKEAQGDIGAACDVIQDVHVETYGSLTKLEKAEYILEQIRLNLLRKDYVRALIQSRKMNRKIIEEEVQHYPLSSYITIGFCSEICASCGLGARVSRKSRLSTTSW